jgi:hypothetical protein
MRTSPLKGMLNSKMGYKRNSPDVDNEFNIIHGNEEGTSITMKDVDFPIKAIDSKGNKKTLNPGDPNITFPGDKVIETKL